MAFIPADARWYLADIVLEFRIEDDPRNLVHTNSHLIEADSPDQAYDKAMALGRESEDEGFPNTEGKLVQTIFRGLKGLYVIHEPLEDGAELIYSQEIGVSAEQLRNRIPPRYDLSVFAPRQPRDRDQPNILSESFRCLLENVGFDRDAIDEADQEP